MFEVLNQHYIGLGYKRLGYTLVEMLITISILAILSALTAPSMAPFVAGQQLKALTQDLTDTLQLARSESLVNGTPYRITPISNNWSNGWNIDFRLGSGSYAIFKRYPQNNPRLYIAAASRTGSSQQIAFDQNARVSSVMRFEVNHNELNIQPYCIEIAASGNTQVIRGVCNVF